MHLLSENILHILHSLYLQQKICAAAKIRNFPQLLFLLLSETDVTHPEIQHEPSSHFSDFYNTQKQIIHQLHNVLVRLNCSSFLCSCGKTGQKCSFVQ